MLEPLAPARAARLLAQAAFNVGTLRWAEFVEERHPRDERGRFGPGGVVVDRPKALDLSRPILGVVGPHGDVRAKNPNALFNDHDQLFGGLHPATQRWRAEGGRVTWDDAPSADDYFAVEDFFAGHGARVEQYAQDGARVKALDPRALAEFDEAKHPRDERGRFDSGDGGQSFVDQHIAGRKIVEQAKAQPLKARDSGPEADAQQALADAQPNPLAHPDIVLGLDQHGPEAMRYVAAYGQEHAAAALQADIERGTPKECYKNASLLVMEHPELDYAEGFAKSDRTGDLTFMHAWGVTKDGMVVDPTWDRPENGKYFGVRYERGKYLQYLYKAKVYGVLGSTRKNAGNAIATGGRAIRSLAEWDEAQHPRDEKGQFSSTGVGSIGVGSTGGSMLDKPSSHYEPMRADGLDTRERFSDGKGHYTEERTKLHEEIVAKYMANTTPVERPVAMILGGGMGAGKSTLVKSEGLVKENTVSVNVDEIRRDLPELREATVALTKGEAGVSTAMTHEEASDIGKALMERALAGSRNMTLDGTGNTTLEKLGGKTALMRASGHEVVAEYVTVPLKDAIARADERARTTDRRFVPATAMKEVHEAVSRIYPEAIRQGLFDRARLYDTRGPRGSKPALVMSAKGKEITVHDQALWEEFLVKGHLGH